jgi:hypothetical protein
MFLSNSEKLIVMPKKESVYVVTKKTTEEGIECHSQFVIKARSLKEAMKEALEREGITITEHAYGAEQANQQENISL